MTNIARNLTGERFGHLTVLGMAGSHPRRNWHPLPTWHCRCDCGNESVIIGSSLTRLRNPTKSCGCRGAENLSGRTFGHLIVLGKHHGYVDRNGRRPSVWRCRCECGAEVTVKTYSLLSGKNTGCGKHKGLTRRVPLELTTPWCSYLLGLAQTDGHMRHLPPFKYDHRGYLRICLRERDGEVLRQLGALIPYPTHLREQTCKPITIKTNGKEYNYQSYKLLELRVSCCELLTTMAEWGMPYGKKSLTIEPAAGPLARRDYVRGLIDGDGSIGFGHSQRGWENPYIGFVTVSEPMAQYMRAFLDEMTGTTRSMHRNKRDGAFNLCVWAEDAIAVCKELYYEGCLAIQRKREMAQRVTGWMRPEGIRRLRRCGPRRETNAECAMALAEREQVALASEIGRMRG